MLALRSSKILYCLYKLKVFYKAKQMSNINIVPIFYLIARRYINCKDYKVKMSTQKIQEIRNYIVVFFSIIFCQFNQKLTQACCKNILKKTIKLSS